MAKQGIRIRKSLYIVLCIGTVLSLILCIGIAFGFFTKEKIVTKEVEKEVKRNIASYKDLALQTVDEAKESIIASAKEKLGEMGQGNALIGKLKDMIGTSQNKRTAEAASFNGVPAKTLKESLERVSDGLLSTLSVTDECVSGESKVVNNYDKNWLMSPGIAIRPTREAPS